MSRSLVSAYGTSLLGVVSGLVTNLWVLREVTRSVSPEAFGVYAVVVQIVAYLGILQWSLDFAAARQIAECLGRGDQRAATSAYWTLVTLNRRLGITAGVLAAALAGSFAHAGLFGFGGGHSAAGIAAVSGAAQVLAFFSRPAAAALIGGQRQAVLNTITVCRTIGSSLVAYGLLQLGLGILALPVADCAFSLIALVALRFTASRCSPWITEPEVSDRESLTRLAVFAGGSSVGGIAWTVESTVDVLILGATAGPKVAAAYVLWWRFPQMILTVCTRLAESAFPAFAARYGRSPAEARDLLAQVGQVTVGLATLASVGIALWLPAFVRIWLDGAFEEPQGSTIALAMGVLVGLRAVGNLLGLFWLSSGRATANATLAVLQAAAKVGLALWLVRDYGVVGVLAASVAASALQVAGLGLLLAFRRSLPADLVRTGASLGIASVAAGLLVGEAAAGVTTPVFLGGVPATAVVWAGLWVVAVRRSGLGLALGRMTGLTALAPSRSRSFGNGAK